MKAYIRKDFPVDNILFVLEVVKAHAVTSPEHPKTMRYRGDGVIMNLGDQ